MRSLSIALAGNPNSGKTTLFNVLTGSSQHVGNWPGKTVEKRSGSFSARGARFDVIDLPGTYSLAAVSPEEVVARDFLPERNLSLTVQVLELGVPCVVALNMADTAEARGLRIDHGILEDRLGIPVVRTVARRREGVDALIDAVLAVTGERAA